MIRLIWHPNAWHLGIFRAVYKQFRSDVSMRRAWSQWRYEIVLWVCHLNLGEGDWARWQPAHKLCFELQDILSTNYFLTKEKTTRCYSKGPVFEEKKWHSPTIPLFWKEYKKLDKQKQFKLTSLRTYKLTSLTLPGRQHDKVRKG